MATHGQIIISRKTHQEVVLVDAAGQEIARVRITGGATRVAIAAASHLHVVRGEVFDECEPRKHPESRWDLVSLSEAAEIATDSEAGFLAAVDRGELPSPARRWRRDGRGGWEGDSRWRRGELLAAVANRVLRRQQAKVQELAGMGGRTETEA